jgi:hypothetical protein
MRLMNNPTARSESVDEGTLDLNVLGRLVRQGALDAVAMHFYVLSRMSCTDSTAGETDHKTDLE